LKDSGCQAVIAAQHIKSELDPKRRPYMVGCQYCDSGSPEVICKKCKRTWCAPCYNDIQFTGIYYHHPHMMSVSSHHVYAIMIGSKHLQDMTDMPVNWQCAICDGEEEVEPPIRPSGPCTTTLLHKVFLVDWAEEVTSRSLQILHAPPP
jgi:hypothetical protein